MLDEIGVPLTCRAEDVSLLRYLIDSNLRPSSAKAFAQDYSMPEDCCGCALQRAYRDALEKTKGTAEEKLYRDLELPLSRVLVDMERIGVRVDMSKFSVFSEKFKGTMAELSARIFELAGVSPFNLNSPFQLSEVLFEKLGYSASEAVIPPARKFWKNLPKSTRSRGSSCSTARCRNCNPPMWTGFVRSSKTASCIRRITRR